MAGSMKKYVICCLGIGAFGIFAIVGWHSYHHMRMNYLINKIAEDPFSSEAAYELLRYDALKYVPIMFNTIINEQQKRDVLVLHVYDDNCSRIFDYYPDNYKRVRTYLGMSTIVEFLCFLYCDKENYDKCYMVLPIKSHDSYVKYLSLILLSFNSIKLKPWGCEVIELLEDPNEDVRSAACEAIEALECVPTDAIKLIHEMVHDVHDVVCISAVKTLIKLNELPDSEIQSIIDRLYNIIQSDPSDLGIRAKQLIKIIRNQ